MTDQREEILQKFLTLTESQKAAILALMDAMIAKDREAVKRETDAIYREAERKVTICFTEDNNAVIRWPAGTIPDEATCEEVKRILRQQQEKIRR